ncbi:MAG: glycosyl hydrolase family 65 protein [Oscillospiraceae bacterium]
MALRDKFSSKIKNILSSDEWLVAEESYNPRENSAYESIFCLASGSMGNRASHEEGDVRNTLPANYVHGVFDRSEAFQRELCNTPDWCKLKMYFECDPIGVESGKSVTEYIRVLDMKNGIVAKHYICEAYDGRKTKVEILKFLSRKSPKCGAFRVYLTPLNYSGIIEFENIIDATVTNFIDFPRFRVKHLNTTQVTDFSEFGIYVQSETRDLKLSVGTGTAVKILDENNNDILKSRCFKKFGELASEFLDVKAKEAQTITIEKYAAVTSEKDFSDVKEATEKEIRAIFEKGFDKELDEHIEEYKKLWDMGDIIIKGDDSLQKALRFNVFHLMSTPNPNDNRTNIGAKLIHGEEYGGHAFWDTELFILPFFDYVFPKVARNLVEYRYLLLDKARENAKNNGYLGAKYPWESADTGDEECPSWTIEPDGSCERCYVADYEHHVTAAVAYGAMKYATITGDTEFFDNIGIEIFVETARFWVSRLELNENENRYEIHKVTGPDEWHEPVNNNAYTNHLAKWNITKALEVLSSYKTQKPQIYSKLKEKIFLSEEELQDWEEKAQKIYVRNKTGLIEQFDNYFKLEDAVIEEWDKNGMPVLPKKLESFPKEQRCILKQADVIMLMFLMEYEFDLETQRINFDYYEKRTLHRSSLSPSIHALMGLRVGDSKRAYSYLERSAYVDITNNQRNTKEGIHAASAGGTWQCVTLGYCGMSIDNDGGLVFTPHLPQNWSEVNYSICWKGSPMRITVKDNDVTIILEDAKETVMYKVRGKEKYSKMK